MFIDDLSSSKYFVLTEGIEVEISVFLCVCVLLFYFLWVFFYNVKERWLAGHANQSFISIRLTSSLQSECRSPFPPIRLTLVPHTDSSHPSPSILGESAHEGEVRLADRDGLMPRLSACVISHCSSGPRLGKCRKQTNGDKY